MRVASILLLLTAAPTAHASAWTLGYHVDRNDSVATDGSPRTNFNGNVSLDPGFSPDLLAFTIYDSAGAVRVQKKTVNGAIVGTPISRSTGAAVLADLSAGPWRLDMTTPLGTSRYAFTPNLSALNESKLPRVTSHSPALGEAVVGGRAATFAWTMAGSFTSGSVYPGFGGFHPIDAQPLSRTLNVNIPAATGPRTFVVTLDRYVINDVPIAATLVSGVDQGTFSGTSRLGYTLTSNYTVVVPEPATLGIVAVAAIGVLGRRR